MVAIRSNLNSVCNVSEGLLVLKKRLATCFKVCRRFAHQTTKTTKCNFKEEREHHLFFTEPTAFNEKNTKGFHLLNTRLRNIFVSKKSRSNRESYQKFEDQEVKIVAQVLSSTFIATTTAKATAAFGDCITGSELVKQEEDSISNSNSQTMTIGQSFLDIEEEYPELQSEIRSILTTHTKNGATISILRDDYEKLTGNRFPVYENIVEYLLSIPFVTAYCNEHGTIIFNVKPAEKTKHLHEMIVGQKSVPSNHISRVYGKKTAPQQLQTRCVRSNFENNNNNYNVNYRHKRKNYDNDSEPSNMMKLQRFERKSESIDSGLENKCCYEDNYNYLQSRFNNQKYISTMSYGNDVNNEEFDQFCQPQQQSQKHYQQQPNLPTSNTQKSASMNPCRGTYQGRTQLPYGRSSWTTPVRRINIYNESPATTPMESAIEARYLDFPLLGDDFFLYLARMELKCKFKRNERILQSGLCASGQTIKAAIRRIQSLPNIDAKYRNIIVNIGSVDIMQGKALIEIEHDFVKLLELMHRNHLNPILTTLAPLANYSHVPQLKNKLERFNEFIKTEGRFLVVIDIWQCLVDQNKHVLFDCFQNEPRKVTGTSEPHVFWNKIGRQRVLQTIRSSIAY